MTVEQDKKDFIFKIKWEERQETSQYLSFDLGNVFVSELPELVLFTDKTCKSFKHKQTPVCSFHHEDLTVIHTGLQKSVCCIFIFPLWHIFIVKKKHFKEQKKNLTHFKIQCSEACTSEMM